jgi:hypothetical protein
MGAAFVLLLSMLGASEAAAQAPAPSTRSAPPASAAPPRCDGACVKTNLDKAAPGCARQIEAQAPVDFDWLTRPFTGIFQQGDQSSGSDSVVRYRGDSIRFLNPQKEWVRVSYECGFDAADQKDLYVNIRPGRLDRPANQSVAAAADRNPAAPGLGAPPQMTPPSNVAMAGSATGNVSEPSAIEIMQVDPRRKRP